MAREESDREDLLREATALVERIELAPIGGGVDDHIVAGFRARGGLSVYFGQDRCYQFNSHGELRRAYIDGLLIKSESGRLVALKRQRSENEVQLVRRPMSDASQAAFLSIMGEHLQAFASNCVSTKYRIVGQVPSDTDVLSNVLSELKSLSSTKVAQSPRAG